MERTWITYSLAIVLFCAGAWWASSWLKGADEQTRQMEVVDVDVATHPGRALISGQAWSHVYSPRTHVYDLRLEAPKAWSEGEARAGFVSFQGLPGTGFDGMHAPAVAPTWPGAYESFPQSQSVSPLRGMPIEAASTKSLYGRWWWEGKLPAESNLRETSSSQPLGTFQNPLPFELHDCRIVYHRWITPSLGKLAPGQTFELTSDLTPIDLEYKLTLRRDADAKEYKVVHWDQSSHDLERLAEVFFFHEASGGKAHTHLTNRYQCSVDMTLLLRSGRAVLWGRAPSKSAKLFDGERPIGRDDDAHWTWYRIVFPVKQVDWKPRADL